MDVIREPERTTPVAYDVDVVVAGAGVSGVFAAISAARSGARTVLIDRFGEVGGNIGPGRIIGGSIYYESEHIFLPPSENPVVLAGNQESRGLAGIPKEFSDRFRSVRGESAQEENSETFLYSSDSQTAQYVALCMLEEAGVTMMLSSVASDAIMEGDRLRGVVVENASGRQAVLARVIIDATGVAAVASRAGAPVVQKVNPDPVFAPAIPEAKLREEYRFWDEMGVYFVIGGIDQNRFKDHVSGFATVSVTDARWVRETLGIDAERLPAYLVPVIRDAWNEFRIVHDSGKTTIGPPSHSARMPFLSTVFDGMMGTRVCVTGELDSSDGAQVTDTEIRLRKYVFEFTRMLKKRVPGFENAFLVTVSPFLHSRGGAVHRRCIYTEAARPYRRSSLRRCYVSLLPGSKCRTRFRARMRPSVQNAGSQED